MRAAALYRVSTKRQARGEDDSIHAQQAVVRRYAAERGLELVREYVEPGVSAYKLSFQERDILQDALADAAEGLFDVLLVFKADRLSRNAFEYPLVLWQLRQAGVEVVAVAEGRRLDIEDQMEKLVRFIEGWQAETESRNTSLRVSAVMRERAKQGHWSGGPPPYGFRLSERRGGLPLEIDPREAEVIREMVRLYLEEGMGSKMVAGELNRRGIRTRSGRLWRDERVRRVLQNPIIAGLPAYDRTRPGPTPGSRVRVRDSHNLWNPEIIIPRDERGNPKPIPEYQIIPLEEWLEVMELMRRRAFGATPDMRSRRGPALLTGLLRCGYCGRGLISSQVSFKNRGLGPYWYYRCITHVRSGAEYCGGKGSYSQDKIDRLVLAELEEFFGKVDLGDLERYVDARHGAALLAAQKRAAELERELFRVRQRLDRWVERLNRYFADPQASLYSEELMAREIRRAEEEAASLEKELAQARAEVEASKRERGKLARFAKLAPRWLEFFKKAPRQVQKEMLAHVIDRIILWEDRIEIRYSVSLADLGRAVGAEQEDGTLETKVIVNWQ